MSWCFTIINGRLAEIYFRKTAAGKTEITGHCYVRRGDFKTKSEQGMIDQDIKRMHFTYRKGKFKSQLDNKVIRQADMKKERARIEKEIKEGKFYTLDEMPEKLKKRS